MLNNKNIFFTKKYFNLFNNLNFKSFALKFNKKVDVCYYKLLNLNSNAPIEEIKKEYYKLAKKYHPDNKENSAANQTVL
jgi:DnaJ-class molecular chaperone